MRLLRPVPPWLLYGCCACSLAEVLRLGDLVYADRAPAARIEHLSLQPHAELDHDVLGGVVADLRDAHDPLQAAVDQPELESCPRRLGGQSLPPEGAPEPPADLDGWHYLGHVLRHRKPRVSGQIAGAAYLQREQPEAVAFPFVLPRLDGRSGLLDVVDGSIEVISAK